MAIHKSGPIVADSVGPYVPKVGDVVWCDDPSHKKINPFTIDLLDEHNGIEYAYSNSMENMGSQHANGKMGCSVDHLKLYTPPFTPTDTGWGGHQVSISSKTKGTE